MSKPCDKSISGAFPVLRDLVSWISVKGSALPSIQLFYHVGFTTLPCWLYLTNVSVLLFHDFRYVLLPPSFSNVVRNMMIDDIYSLDYRVVPEIQAYPHMWVWGSACHLVTHLGDAVMFW